MKPQSLMMSYGYKPELSEGAIKPPIFQTSTFAFASAEEGRSYFELAYGLREAQKVEELGLIYSRINNPNLEILEDRLCLWDEAENCAVFESGMSAISTVLLEFLKPGNLMLYSMPIYGGTQHLINNYLRETNIHSLGFLPQHSKQQIIERIEKSGLKDELRLIYVETPANPTNALIDIDLCLEVASYFSSDERKVYVVTDNTYMGPIWSQPLKLGVDIVVYSATKYIGGHSDLIAGAVLGKEALLKRVKILRTFLGNMASPHTCWLLLRSLETLKVRMDQQASNAGFVADYLRQHPRVKKLYYLDDIDPSTKEFSVYKRQYSSPGAMISFEIEGGLREAFKFLNKLKLIKLAVSLGSTESLAQHPATMTHVGVSEEIRNEIGITDSLIRLSIGVEYHEDLINDLAQAFE